MTDDNLIASINGKAIVWNQRGVVHAVVGADIDPDVRLLWTICEIDVPANAAHLMAREEDTVNCPKCMEKQND